MSEESSWLSPRTVDFELDTTLLARVLIEYRKSKGLTQADLAQLLNVDQSYVSKIEKKQRQVRDLQLLLRIAQQLDISPTELGVSKVALQPVPSPATDNLVGEVNTVELSQAKWRNQRRNLNQNRVRLARLAAKLYQPDVKMDNSTFLAPQEWVPARPIAIEEIELRWDSDHVPVSVTGTEPEADQVLPLRAAGRRFDRYTSAVRYIERPSLFENRASYRLLDVDLAAKKPYMRFGLGTYFDKLDVSEAVAHELALVTMDRPPSSDIGWSALPLRALIGNPFDFSRRGIMPAIETLTLRRQRNSKHATFLLHWRDPAKVATAGGIYGLIPAGEFQPSSVASWDKSNDFDLWKNMVREYSEELLGEPERDGSSSQPLNYDEWSLYRELQQARSSNRVTVHCLGIGLDTLTLTATVLTVAVMDDDVFDALFGESVRINEEGVLVTASESSSVSDGIPFNQESVGRLLTKEPIASPGARILARAWRFRDHLLSG